MYGDSRDATTSRMQLARAVLSIELDRHASRIDKTREEISPCKEPC